MSWVIGLSPVVNLLVFFFNDTATTEIYTLSLHDALPISGLRFAVLDEVYRDANRRILLVAQRESWRFVHQHDLARVVNPKARTGFGAARLQLRLDGVAQAHQDDVDVRVGFQEIERRRHGDVRTMIAAHAIDGYCDFHEARCEAVPASLNARADPDSVRSLRPDEVYSLLVLTTFLPR